MVAAVPMVDVWRGDMVESQHLGHAVICDGTGQIVDAWGDPGLLVYPRSSAKMIQALPLIESGAADAAGLTSQQLALSCASHTGAALHTDAVRAWLDDLGMGDDDFRCGSHMPFDEDATHELIRVGTSPCQVHNNCSGKHAGFLTLARHLGAGPDYVDLDHPVQLACRAAFEEVTGEDSPGFGIDGCSAPNFATRLQAMAAAMARFASAKDTDTRGRAMQRLWQAMATHPTHVAGVGQACTDLMRAAKEPLAIKTGAEGFYVGILPARGLGIALKISDGATRASESVIAALLVRLGVLEAADPAVQKYLNPPVLNCRQRVTGHTKPNPSFLETMRSLSP
ncbi:MAG: asparaginase [Pseudomonadota bacterium]